MLEHDEAETPLQMTQRHVIEGTGRILRQEALIARLRQAGHENMLHKANELLGEMREFQGGTEAHLAREVAKSAGGQADPATS